MEAPLVARRPSASHTNSSSVSQPTPCMKPPSICPRSTTGEMLSPTSSSRSARSTRYCPVKASTSTSETGRAVCVVVERMTLMGLRIVMNLRRAVVPRSEQGQTLPICRLHHLGEAKYTLQPPGRMHAAILEVQVRGVAFQQFGRHPLERGAKGAARIERRRRR